MFGQHTQVYKSFVFVIIKTLYPIRIDSTVKILQFFWLKSGSPQVNHQSLLPNGDYGEGKEARIYGKEEGGRIRDKKRSDRREIQVKRKKQVQQESNIENHVYVCTQIFNND